MRKKDRPTDLKDRSVLIRVSVVVEHWLEGVFQALYQFELLLCFDLELRLPLSGRHRSIWMELEERLLVGRVHLKEGYRKECSASTTPFSHCIACLQKTCAHRALPIIPFCEHSENIDTA